MEHGLACHRCRFDSPERQGIFLPESIFSADLWCPYTPMHNHMHLNLCAYLKSSSPCQSSVDYRVTKTPSTHPRLGNATGESHPNFPWEKSCWDNTVVKKRRSKSQKDSLGRQVTMFTIPLGRTCGCPEPDIPGLISQLVF